jgi:hypothetical protein
LTGVVYETLLFFHLLSAFIAFVTLALFSAYALGAPVGRRDFAVADWSWNVSGAGLLGFGVWLALYLDEYEIWDGWILGSLALFAAATAFGGMARNQVADRVGATGPGAAGPGPAVDDAPAAPAVNTWHWLRTLSVVAILVLMVWKPGA